jgi:hypothetical protein
MSIESPAEAVDRVIKRVNDAREAYDRFIERNVPIFGTLEKARVNVVKVNPPQHEKVANEFTEAQNELARLPERYAEQVAKAHDESIAGVKGAADATLETFAVEKNLEPHVAHERLLKVSPTYKRSIELYEQTISEKATVVAKAEMEVANLIAGRLYAQSRAAIEKAQAAAGANETPSEAAVMKRAKVLAELRGVSVEKALADGMGSGEHADDAIRDLYEQAQHERLAMSRKAG